MLEFKSEDKWHLDGLMGGPVYVVRNPKECSDFDWLKEQHVKIDGEQFKVRDIETRMHSAPWKKDELIGLLVYMKIKIEYR